MGTYYRYVNFTLGEFVSLSDLRDGGDKENAAIVCAPALAHLIVRPHLCGDGYRGRWCSFGADQPAYDVRIVTDGDFDFYEMEEGGVSWAKEPFLNITPGLLQSLREVWPGIIEDYRPRVHDVRLLTHVKMNGTYKLIDTVSASCKCGWRVGLIHGENREATLVRIVSDHVSAKKTVSHPREALSGVYRTELSSEDVSALIAGLDEIAALVEYSGENEPRLRALLSLRARLANLRGTR